MVSSPFFSFSLCRSPYHLITFPQLSAYSPPFDDLTKNLEQVKLEYIAMANIVEDKIYGWVQGKDARETRVAIYTSIRDIPYAVIPELNDPERYMEVLKLNRGSCTPKHLLLCRMYQQIGLEVLYVVYPFRWDEVEAIYPPELKKLARAMPVGYHLACKVDVDGKFILVDATLDLALHKIGLPVNREWDGIGDTFLAVNPCGEEELYHPSEAYLMQHSTDSEKTLAFYNGLNLWLEQLRG